MPRKKPEDLRDLARQIDEVAKNHFCYGQVHFPIRQLLDHICAIARIEEMNQSQAEKPGITQGTRVFLKGPHNRGVVLARMGHVCLVAYDSKSEQDLRSINDLEEI